LTALAPSPLPLPQGERNKVRGILICLPRWKPTCLVAHRRRWYVEVFLGGEMKHMIKLLKDVKEKIKEGELGTREYTLDDLTDDIDYILEMAREHDNKHFEKQKMFHRKK
jgi:hypothetical protein